MPRTEKKIAYSTTMDNNVNNAYGLYRTLIPNTFCGVFLPG